MYGWRNRVVEDRHPALIALYMCLQGPFLCTITPAACYYYHLIIIIIIPGHFISPTICNLLRSAAT
jgi:hypothetical protein